MAKLFAGSVGSAEVWYDGSGTPAIVAVCNTLTESTLNITTTQDEVRGGLYAPVQYTFTHDASGKVTLTDILWKPEYLEMQLGKKFESGANSEYYYSKSGITPTDSTHLPLDAEVAGLTPSCGTGAAVYAVAYSIDGKDSWSTGDAKDNHKVVVGTFDTKAKYCVRYCRTNSTEASKIAVSAHIIPGEYRLVIRAPLFAGDACSASQASLAGEVQYVVPRFKLDGQVNLTMAMSTNQTQSINGTMLAEDSGCDMEGGKLCDIIKVITGDKWYNNGVGFALGEEKAITGDSADVYLVYKDGATKKLGNAELSSLNATALNGVIVNGTGSQFLWGAALANGSITIDNSSIAPLVVNVVAA